MIFFLMIWSICSVGLFALASSMEKHQKQIFGQKLASNKTRLATIAGWVLLIIALILSVQHAQLSNMISYWIGVITFSSLWVGLSLSYFESKLKQIWIATGVIAIISLILHFI